MSDTPGAGVLVSDSASSRRALDEESGDGFTRIRLARARRKFEHFTGIERIRNAQRLTYGLGLHCQLQRNGLIRPRHRCVTGSNRSEAAVQRIPCPYGSNGQRQCDREFTWPTHDLHFVYSLRLNCSRFDFLYV